MMAKNGILKIAMSVRLNSAPEILFLIGLESDYSQEIIFLMKVEVAVWVWEQ